MGESEAGSETKKSKNMCNKLSKSKLSKMQKEILSVRIVRGISTAVAITGLALPAYSTIVQTASGFSSVNQPVSFRASLSISGDILTVVLENTSTQNSTAPSDVLGSYYFDILNGTTRPNLTYVSAVGDVWLAKKGTAADVLQTPGANLKAVAAGANTWQFKTVVPSSNPFLGFGVGTVGNSSLDPSSFNGNIVGNRDYSIYAGDISASNLKDTLLVKGPLTFMFSGLTGFTEADINPKGVFGLGTAPDSLMTGVTPTPVPEPATAIAGALLLLPFGATTLRMLRKNRKV